jgi:hypothetical protein
MNNYMINIWDLIDTEGADERDQVDSALVID